MRLKDNFPAVFVLIVPGKPKHTPFQNQNQVVSGPIPNQTRNSVVEKKCCNNCKGSYNFNISMDCANVQRQYFVYRLG